MTTPPVVVHAESVLEGQVMSGATTMIGWAVIGIWAAALLGRAELKETTAFVLQMHGLEVSAFERSKWEVPEPSL